ncbi:MAG: hypothetical protein RL077_2449, partial [Verrucomicrobiota bacterium]
VLGKVQTVTGSFVGGIFYLSVSITVSAIILFFIGLGGREKPGVSSAK